MTISRSPLDRNSTAAKPIEAGTYLGVTQSGNGRDYIVGDYISACSARLEPPPKNRRHRGSRLSPKSSRAVAEADHGLGQPTRPAMSNKEIEDRKTILAAAAEGHKPQKLR